MKKRPIFVTKEDYQKVVNLIDKAGFKNWNETETFYISKVTIAVCVFAFILLAILIF